MMEIDKLNGFLSTLVSSAGDELRLEPNKNPYVLSSNGSADVDSEPLPGSQISTMVFPLIPAEIRSQLPGSDSVEFVHPHNLGKFSFNVQKSSAGFVVSVRPLAGEPPQPVATIEEPVRQVPNNSIPKTSESTTFTIDSTVRAEKPISIDAENYDLPTVEFGAPDVSASTPTFDASILDEAISEPAPEYFPQVEVDNNSEPFAPLTAEPLQERRQADRRHSNSLMQDRMDALFHKMAEAGASDLHMSVSVPPMIRLDGKIADLGSDEGVMSAEVIRELLLSIMPEKNREEFEQRHDTDFAYEITGLARFRCNIFMDRKGMGSVFRIIPVKMTTAEQLGLSKAILDLCNLSKGLVVVTGPTGSGKSTTLCAMVNHINLQRQDHIITIEDPIEFVHDNIKCLVNQREVHNHTDSFKDALRAALREDPDILLVGEMRDLETVSIAIETAETGHLVFGTLHTTTAASTVDRIIDQFPADRQQQIRVMLSESLKGVIAQTLLPKKGGGRVAALEVLIVTPAISNLIREGKTFQIPSAMQTGKTHGMVMLNDSLFELVKNGLVEPRDAYIKAVDKANFETMLTRGGFKI